MPQSTNLNILLSGCCKFYAALTAKDVRSQEAVLGRVADFCSHIGKTILFSNLQFIIYWGFGIE